ncbi:helix-turn-helix domain-containing protein [Georgenia satyanarayanai]|uniref:helix-turn-helix domain-containing protein n=1 Tax=Georgenia satyanarayanai TaxID=860221 RepID=UPI00203B7845|nr:helix-turn-helix transcriptional regulator [Georgenia satyanarayanai]MCM3662613.1 helix-turn-helix domain-containing protein [Georgenia satyanarayanai]
MAKSFDALATRAKEKWSPDARAVYDAASRTFQAEVTLQLAFGEQLAKARKERHIKQAELADLTGIDQAEISRIENGRSNPTLATVSRLLTALEYTAQLTPQREEAVSAPK